MRWRVPSSTVKGATTLISSFTSDSTFAPLGAGASYTGVPFNISFTPLFDIYAFMDQPGTIQAQVEFQTVGVGSTFRNIDPAMNVIANVAFKLVGYRLPNFNARFIITNTGGAATITEFVVINRAL